MASKDVSSFLIAASTCAWRIVILQATGHVTLLHSVPGLAGGLSWWALILKVLAPHSILARDSSALLASARRSGALVHFV
jgi:hypothetical protein